jgi:glutathione S-transferase
MHRLFYHPFSSFCQKALIGLYELDVPFESEIVDLGDSGQRATLERHWPLAKFPVLQDEERGLVIPESSVIIAYVDRHGLLVPSDRGAAIPIHILDRLFDNYVMAPMQKIVGDALRPTNRRDPEGVEQAATLLRTAYDMLEGRLAANVWAAGDEFTLADCAAAPALFYANIVQPFAGRAKLEAYYGRLLARPSIARVIEEARPYRHLFPLEWPVDYP